MSNSLNLLIKRLRGNLRTTIVFISTWTLITTTFANPVGPQIGSGHISISSPTPNSMVIQQATDKAIINWQSYNIGAEESVHYQQPNTGSVTLNRINPQQGVSQIYGRLTANGQIILINPAGIYFGPHAYVNVSSLIATTSNLSDQNFLNGQYIFDEHSSYTNASIINEGTIIAANHGLVALVGPNVTNNGFIQAHYGQVALAAGDAFTVSFTGDQLINFAMNATSRPSKVTNNGTLLANGGRVLITAKQASQVLDNVINVKGIVKAQSVYEKNGDIIISGDPNGGVVHIDGTLDASNYTGLVGGHIDITGYNILLHSSARIDVSGNTGGGKVH
jgi:filamentous hemagglutinin family protein